MVIINEGNKNQLEKLPVQIFLINVFFFKDKLTHLLKSITRLIEIL